MIKLYTSPEPTDSCIYLYKDFCIKQLNTIQVTAPLSIYLDIEPTRDYIKPAITAHINYEHTIVQEGGRGIKPNTELTSLVSSTGKRYALRIDKEDQWRTATIILDYSMPNIEHCKLSKQGWLKEKKHIYIPPLLYPLQTENTNRNIQVLTTFLNIHEPRRFALLQLFKSMSIPVMNINTIFSENDTLQLYQNTRILINIHQTDDHHTFEELRCLPAILNGVLVISEDVPYRESIPYHEYIIWARYDSIVQTTQDVMFHYEEYRNKIFGNLKLAYTIENMKIELKRMCSSIFKHNTMS